MEQWVNVGKEVGKSISHGTLKLTDEYLRQNPAEVAKALSMDIFKRRLDKHVLAHGLLSPS